MKTFAERLGGRRERPPNSLQTLAFHAPAGQSSRSVNVVLARCWLTRAATPISAGTNQNRKRRRALRSRERSSSRVVATLARRAELRLLRGRDRRLQRFHQRWDHQSRQNGDPSSPIFRDLLEFEDEHRTGYDFQSEDDHRWEYARRLEQDFFRRKLDDLVQRLRQRASPVSPPSKCGTPNLIVRIPSNRTRAPRRHRVRTVARRVDADSGGDDVPPPPRLAQAAARALVVEGRAELGDFLAPIAQLAFGLHGEVHRAP
jgi:hypothetical protein